MNVQKDVKRSKTETEIKQGIWSKNLCFTVCVYVLLF